MQQSTWSISKPLNLSKLVSDLMAVTVLRGHKTTQQLISTINASTVISYSVETFLSLSPFTNEFTDNFDNLLNLMSST